MAASITERWTPEGKRFATEMKKLSKYELCVGFQSDGGGEEGEPDIVDIAAYNEYGTYASEARPFMAQTVEKHGDKIRNMFEQSAAEIQNGSTVEAALNTVGVQAVTYMQQSITDGNYKPNAPITVKGGWMKNKKSGKPFKIKGKKTAQPLIGSGRMRASVTYVVRAKTTDGGGG